MPDHTRPFIESHPVLGAARDGDFVFSGKLELQLLILRVVFSPKYRVLKQMIFSRA